MDGTKSTRTFGAESPFGKGHFLCFCVSVVFFSLGISIHGRGSEAANSRWGGGGGEKGGERGGGRGDMGERDGR